MIQLPSYGGWSPVLPLNVSSKVNEAESVSTESEEREDSLDEAPLLPGYADNAYKNLSMFSFSFLDLKSHRGPEKFSWFASAKAS
jgi:hypothetical protein